MSSSTQTVAEWEKFFRSVAHHLKARAKQRWPLERDGSGSDDTLTLHRLFSAFPLPVDVLLLDTTGVESNIKEGNLAAMIRYDFSRPNTLAVRLHGLVPLSDIGSHVELINSLVELDERELQSLQELKLRSVPFFPYYVDVVPYDPRPDPARYAVDFGIFFDADGEFWELFDARRDFNAKYDLKPDPVLDEADLLRVDDLNSSPFPRDRATAIRQIQEAVVHIQLIRQVPEHPRRVFERAKRLYIFGLFEYSFFTISAHYAYLAVESAVYNRWNAALPNPTILQHGSDTITVPHRTRHYISVVCKEKGWKERDVTVNGKPYPRLVGMAIDQLRQDGLINIWQHKRLKESWMKLRNMHSHLEFASINGPRAGVLERAAEMINILFESVKP